MTIPQKTSRRFLFAAGLLLPLLGSVAHAADAAKQAPASTPYPLILGPIRLWEGDAPGALGQRPQDTPTLTPYRPAAGIANGAAMIVLPGG
ncbi:MAG: hypothetical protein ABIQ12_07620, partial [Opitutaceae bacterium]